MLLCAWSPLLLSIHSMMNLYLPKNVEIDGTEYEIRYDFRVILEIIVMLSDPELNNNEKAEALLTMFYLEPETIKDPKAAVEACFRFIDGNSDRKPAPKGKRLIDWEQDFNHIIAPVNHILGYDARNVSYDPEDNTGGLHWWTFLGAFMEIGSDSLFSQIVSIRDKQAHGKKLDKHEREWLRRNTDLVTIKNRYSMAENELVDAWTKGVKPSG